MDATCLLVGALVWQQQVMPTPRLVTRSLPSAITPWKPHDPHLVGAAIELNIARDQLVRAIQQAPQALYLQHMLEHANQQVHHLQQQSRQAG